MADDVARKLDAIDARLKAIGMLLLIHQLPEEKKAERERLLQVAANHLGIPRL